MKEVLLEKHPLSRPATKEALIQSEAPPHPHPIIFEALDASKVRTPALRTQGAAGPSGLDAHCWRRLCTSFKGASNDLCNSIAKLAVRLCTTYVDPKIISPLLACRLIAINKNLGVRPIGICETVRRIIGKAVLSIIGNDIIETAGCLQICTGQPSGCEAAVHAMRRCFENNDAEAVLLVDASNAFNSLNRHCALHNIQRLCPPLATILINTYREPSELFVNDSTIWSQEGTTQGDPLAMPMYALATIPLIQRLKSNILQVWYTDDASAVRTLTSLREWWDKLSTIGPSFGYHANPSKTWLITKDHLIDEAQSTFSDTGINLTSEGRPYLGAPIGSEHFTNLYVTNKVIQWSTEVNTLANLATSQPHVTYAAYTHGLTSRWSYLARTTPDISDNLQSLETAIRTRLLPAISGRNPPGDLERELLGIPGRHGGIAIPNPIKTSDREFASSQQITMPLTDLILANSSYLSSDTITEMSILKKQIHRQNRAASLSAIDDLRPRLDDDLKRAVELASEKGASSWLTTLPLTEHGFSLHKGAFHDALPLRYGWLPSQTPIHCNCGSSFSIEHSLSCHKGGFTTLRHNEVRDVTARLLTEICHEVRDEPHLQALSGEAPAAPSAITQDGARLDIETSGFWGGRFERTLIDVCIFNPHAPSNRGNQLSSIYRRHENHDMDALPSLLLPPPLGHPMHQRSSLYHWTPHQIHVSLLPHQQRGETAPEYLNCQIQITPLISQLCPCVYFFSFFWLCPAFV